MSISLRKQSLVSFWVELDLPGLDFLWIRIWIGEISGFRSEKYQDSNWRNTRIQIGEIARLELEKKIRDLINPERLLSCNPNYGLGSA